MPPSRLGIVEQGGTLSRPAAGGSSDKEMGAVCYLLNLIIDIVSIVTADPD